MNATNNEGVDIHTLQSSITENTKLLIINYDTMRYHSFDLFRYLLLNRDLFVRIKPEYKLFLKDLEFEYQLNFYRHTMKDLNPLCNFDYIQYPNTELYFEQKLNDMFNNKRVKITPTNLSSQLGISFQRKDINGYLLQYKNDPYFPEFKNLIKIINSDHVLNMTDAANVILSNNINAVIISSIKLAIELSLILIQNNYIRPMSFIIANYQYNYENNKLQDINILNNLEYTYKYEFGLFDPFSGLTYKEKLRREIE